MDISNITGPARKILRLKYCGAVIVAAGSASRMGGIDKVMEPLEGEPMILRTVRAFQNCAAIREIVVVTRQDLITPIMSLCKDMDKVKAVVAGGEDRAESVRLAQEFFPKHFPYIAKIYFADSQPTDNHSGRLRTSITARTHKHRHTRS